MDWQLIGRATLATGFLAAFTAAKAPAAEIKTFHPAGTDVTVIGLAGEIDPSDGRVFAEIAARTERALVVFKSPGGNLLAGLQIGQVIRTHRFATFVSDGDMCASACAMAWLAGVPRAMQAESRIGFHAAYAVRNGAKVEVGTGNALVGAYLNNLGFSFETILYMEQAAPDDITWLTIENARRYGIEVKLVSRSDDSPNPPPARPKVSNSPEPASPETRTAELPRRAPSFLLPELALPQPPGTELTGGIEERARRFVGEYFAHWSESGGAALNYFAGVYASQVTFYGKTIDHETLLASKRGYVQRWPVRVYNARPDTLRTFCSDTTHTCTVTGVVDWECRNPDANTVSKGAANFSLTLALARGRGEILAENGSVIVRGND